MPPILTDAERAAAREHSALARSIRAGLKQQVSQGSLSFTELLALSRTDSSEGRAAAKLRVGEVILALPGVGPATADAGLVAAGINGNRRIRGLGSVQVRKLGEALNL